MSESVMDNQKTLYERTLQEKLRQFQEAPASALTVQEMSHAGKERLATLDALRTLELPPVAFRARLTKIQQLPGKAIDFYSVPLLIDVLKRSNLMNTKDIDALTAPVNERMNIINSMKMSDGRPVAGWIQIRLVKTGENSFVPHYDVYPVFGNTVTQEEQHRIIELYEKTLNERGIPLGPQYLQNPELSTA